MLYMHQSTYNNIEKLKQDVEGFEKFYENIR